MLLLQQLDEVASEHYDRHSLGTFYIPCSLRAEQLGRIGAISPNTISIKPRTSVTNFTLRREEADREPTRTSDPDVTAIAPLRAESRTVAATLPWLHLSATLLHSGGKVS